MQKKEAVNYFMHFYITRMLFVSWDLEKWNNQTVFTLKLFSKILIFLFLIQCFLFFCFVKTLFRCFTVNMVNTGVAGDWGLIFFFKDDNFFPFIFIFLKIVNNGAT